MTEAEFIELVNRNGGFPQNELTEIPNSLYRRVLERLAPIQEGIADKLVRVGGKLGQPLDILPFIPYFITGGHDTSRAMENIAREGLDRPNRHGKMSGNVRAAMDALTASQLSSYYAPMAVGAKLVKRAGKGALNSLIGAEKMVDESRRGFLKGSAALAGAGALGAATPKVVKSVSKLLDEPLLGKSMVDEVASVAPTIAKNGFSLADKLAMMDKFTKSRLWNVDDDVLSVAKRMDANDPDAIGHFINDIDLEDISTSDWDVKDILTLLNKSPEQWEQLAKAQEVLESTSAKQAMLKQVGDNDYNRYLAMHENPAEIDKFLSETPMSRVYKEWDHMYGWSHRGKLRPEIGTAVQNSLWKHRGERGSSIADEYANLDEKFNEIIWGNGVPDEHWLLKDYPDMVDVLWSMSNQ